MLAERQVIEPATELRRRRPKRSDEKEAAPKEAAPAAAPVAAKAEPAAPAQPPRPMIPAAIEGLTAEDRVAFLQHWYPIVRERVDRRASDPDRHAALLSLCDRMNPADWAPEEVEASCSRRARRSSACRTSSRGAGGAPGDARPTARGRAPATDTPRVVLELDGSRSARRR